MSLLLVITVKYKAFRITSILLKFSSRGAVNINSILIFLLFHRSRRSHRCKSKTLNLKYSKTSRREVQSFRQQPFMRLFELNVSINVWPCRSFGDMAFREYVRVPGSRPPGLWYLQHNTADCGLSDITITLLCTSEHCLLPVSIPY